MTLRRLRLSPYVRLSFVPHSLLPDITLVLERGVEGVGSLTVVEPAQELGIPQHNLASKQLFALQSCGDV